MFATTFNQQTTMATAMMFAAVWQAPTQPVKTNAIINGFGPRGRDVK